MRNLQGDFEEKEIHLSRTEYVREMNKNFQYGLILGMVVSLAFVCIGYLLA
jgi:hypothetical protein